MLIGPPTPKPARLDELLDARLAARLDRLDFRTKRLFAGKLQGERRSKKRGQSVEFDDYRDYVPGDDLRHIDWNVYARFDRLFIKLFLEEEDLSVHIALDATASMDCGSPSKLLFGAKIALALASVGLAGNNRVSLSVFGGSTEEGALPARMPEVRGRHHLPRAAKFLMDHAWPAGRRGGGASAFNDGLSTIARTRAGKGVIVVISDFLLDSAGAGYEPGIRALAAVGGYDAWCLQVLAPGELEPEREIQSGVTGDLRLTDVETGRAMEVTITAPLIKRYKERLEQYCQGLRSYCMARRMSHALLRTDSNVETVVLETLRRMGMVG